MPVPGKTLLALAAAVALAAGCSPKPVKTALRGERTLVEASASQVPAWVVREPESDREFHYFRGIRTDAPSLEAGETDARQNALAGIVQFLGLRVTVDYQRLRTEEQTQIRDALRSVGGADIFGTRLSELFYRRWRVVSGDEVHDRYDVYVIVRFPRESVERIKENQRERLRNIEQLMVGAGAGGEVYGQITGAAQALAAINELNESVLITTATAGQADDLKRQALARLARLVGGVRLSIALSAEQVSAGRQEPPFVVTASATTEGPAGVSPAANAPVHMTLGEAAEEKLAWTDERGIARWEVLEIPLAVGAHSVSARLELPESVRGLTDIAESAPTASASLEVVPATRLVKLLVIVTSRPNGRPSDDTQGEARLVEALRGRGFTVVSPSQMPAELAGLDPRANENAALVYAERVGATMLLSGTIETDEATPVEMMNGVYLTSARARFVLTDLATNHVLSTIVLPDDVVKDTRGFGNTPERAAEGALSLSRRGQPNGYDRVAERVELALRR